ncbi:hypothetical protein L249_4398 [Ophiocordyceps polyrhachis-furcata BCC 54312]|uniref:DUF7053 domain-containing protein n=1 Tax=Ophiocordyceps polyrhachis-furcata BCC 54312 TaxID=1330021 RepID=A0A367L7E7_9HYPO|nr:hypothetical protein L249_4398 [Ophiocordyceps polyrhachis-furcata BCC 54312]
MSTTSRCRVLTTTTALPPTATRSAAERLLHSHSSMIDLNPLVRSRQRLSSAPASAPAEERGADYEWYAITDRLCLCLRVTYTASFRDGEDGALATHTFAPLGLRVRGRWELVFLDGQERTLAVRETVVLQCSPLLVPFVRATLKRAHRTLVERFSERVLTMGGDVGFR